MTVAAMKFESPHRMFVLGEEHCPKGLLKTFPAAPKAKWGTPFPIRKPMTKYQTMDRSRANYDVPVPGNPAVLPSPLIARSTFMASSTCLVGFICELKTWRITPFLSMM